MATKGDSDDFVLSPLDRQKARHKDSYFPMSDENTAELRDTDTEFKTADCSKQTSERFFKE